jgi:AcrR family transcriptional regulator
MIGYANQTKGFQLQDAIKNAFIRVYRKKGMNGITVKSLCQEVPIARTTFYAYYEN